MTIGPDPMIRIFLMSFRFGISLLKFSTVRARLQPCREATLRAASAPDLAVECSSARTPWLRELLHQIRELRKKIVRIVRPGRRLRMILHAEQRQRFVAQAFVSVIVQVEMRD